MQFIEVMRVLSAFERHGVAYVLVGSMAMAAQGIVRATRDIDVFVNDDEANIARLKAALQDVFDDPEIAAISAADLAGEYPAIQYVPPESDYWIDAASHRGFIAIARLLWPASNASRGSGPRALFAKVIPNNMFRGDVSP
jgi:hypothetical protein